MVLVWPDTLPQYVNRQNHRQQLADGRLRSSTDVGVGKVRRRYSATVRPVNGDMIMTPNQKIRFERFWDEDTGGGVLPFLFPAIGLHGMPIGTEDDQALTTSDGRPILISAWWLVQFQVTAEPPSLVPAQGTSWQASIQWRILP